MKQCPKCNNDHEKPGTFCSRKCANSRSFSPDANKKRADANRGKKRPAAAIIKSTIGLKKTRHERYLNTPFDELGSENRRRRVFEEQNYACNRCNLTEWQGSPITLELDHKDGNHDNNSRENFEGLCPNCHALTPTWRGRNPDKKGKYAVKKQ